MQKDPIIIKQKKRERNLWTNEEYDQLIKALEIHGKDFKLLAQEVPSRNLSQVRMQCQTLKYKFREDPSAKGAHLLPELERKLPIGKGAWKKQTTSSTELGKDVNQVKEEDNCLI